MSDEVILELKELKERIHKAGVCGENTIDEAIERIVDLEDMVHYWAKEARGGFGEDD
jgi:hypothetical protein